MDVYRFINSKDEANYLRKYKHEFTSAQKAYLVWLCEDATLDERICAWKEILNTTADCECPIFIDGEHLESLHYCIETTIKGQQKLLDRFLDASDGPYFPYASRWSEKPSWVPESWFERHGRWNTLSMPVPFSTFDKCIDYLKRQNDILEKGWLSNSEADSGQKSYDEHIVCKSKLDQGWYSGLQWINDPEPQQSPVEYAVLSSDFEVLRMEDTWYPCGASRVGYLMPDLPIPFERGDIVIEPTARKPQPFVLCFAMPRSPAERACNHPLGGDTLFDYNTAFSSINEEFANPSSSKSLKASETFDWGCGHMKAIGYEVDRETAMPRIEAHGLCGNYLNLEYYHGPFDGRLRQLLLVSRYLKGEIGLECLMDLTYMVAAEERTAQARDFCNEQLYWHELTRLDKQAKKTSPDTAS